MRDDDLIARYVEENPSHPGPADIRLVDSAVPVWALVGEYLAGTGNAAQVAASFAVPCEAVEAALAYYRLHQTVIDARLALNAPATI
jgi:uncharacterized protein (DUF433 family)